MSVDDARRADVRARGSNAAARRITLITSDEIIKLALLVAIDVILNPHIL